jgi:catechol 2,3-dioxygenase-like lactoylglutathione lyase family enzyme
LEYKFEVVPIPVTDIDRAKQFYAECMGFVVDLDTMIGEDHRLVQLTPVGSGCSIHLNQKLEGPPAGSLQGLQLIVDDIEAARAELVGRGVGAGPVQHIEDGKWLEGKGGMWNSFVFLNDPDGNGWVLQERPAAE